MGKQARAQLRLEALVKLALPLLKRAERECPRRGRGRRPLIPDWVLAGLIMTAILKLKKSKSAQYAFLHAHRTELMDWFGTDHFPSRSTYFERYRRGYQLYRVAIRLQGERAMREGIADPTCVAGDKSLLCARGPAWHQRQRREGVCPPGIDRQSTWTFSEYHGWLQGYGYELILTASYRGLSFPLLASVEQAHVREHRTLPEKLWQLPKPTKYVLLDAGYDSNALAEQVEQTASGHRTGRFYLCPPQKPKRTSRKAWPMSRKRQFHHRLREARRARFKQKRFRRIYARRAKTIEPFNDHFKRLFELHDQVWHRGLDNNRTQLLAAIFVYQLLVRYNVKRGNRHCRIKTLLDVL